MNTFLILAVVDGCLHLYQVKTFELARAQRYFERECALNEWMFDTIIYQEVDFGEESIKHRQVEKIGVITAGQIEHAKPIDVFNRLNYQPDKDEE